MSELTKAGDTIDQAAFARRRPLVGDPAEAARDAQTDAAADGGFQPKGMRGFTTPAELLAWAEKGAVLNAAETRELVKLARAGLAATETPMRESTWTRVCECCDGHPTVAPVRKKNGEWGCPTCRCSGPEWAPANGAPVLSADDVALLVPLAGAWSGQRSHLSDGEVANLCASHEQLRRDRAALLAEVERQAGMARRAFDVGIAHQERANRLETAVRDLLAVIDGMDRDLGHRSSGYYLDRWRFERLSAALAGGAARAPRRRTRCCSRRGCRRWRRRCGTCCRS